jgi:uncharacterized membrane protein
MAPLLAGIVLLVLAYTVLVPYPIYLLLLIGGILLVVYGLWVLFRGFGPGPVEPTTRRRRYWY